MLSDSIIEDKLIALIFKNTHSNATIKNGESKDFIAFHSRRTFLS